jgi:Flp pilus assembly protein TadG
MRDNKQKQRAGAAVVEFALVAPIFIMLVLGIIEFGRGVLVQQVITNATREGAREAALPESTVSSVKAKVVEFLADSSIDISPSSVSVNPNPAAVIDNEQIKVSVQVPFSQVSWIPGDFLGGATLKASTKMRSERID